MSVFFEPRPRWGAFMQPPSPANVEDQPSDDNAERPGPRRGGPHHHHRGHPGHRGGLRGHRDDPLGMRGGPFHHRGHHGHHGFEHGPLDDESFAPMRWGRGGMFGHRGHHHPYHGFHHRGHHRGGRGGVRVVPVPLGGGPAAGFDFLSRFASEMGNGFQDFLSGNARGLNDDNKTQVDFEPRADVFDTVDEYVIHVSLPGAQKPDISVEYDAQKSTVRIAGVVHRPEFNEELHAAMVWNERRREVGVFERSFKFIPSGAEPVDVDGENITAKMVDGILIVRLPKTQKEDRGERQNKKIVINENDDLYDANPVEDMTKEVENTESEVTNEKHASVVEVQDEMDSMHITSDTEAGDLLEEVDQTIYTPSLLSEEDAEEAAEYVRVDTK